MRSGSVRTTVAFVCLLCLSTPTVAQTGGHVWPGERYGTAVVAAVVAVFLLQSALIVALLLERRVRRRAQAALIESEARAEIAGVSLGVGFWSWDPDRDCVWISEQCARLCEVGETVTHITSARRFVSCCHLRFAGDCLHSLKQLI